MPRRLNAKLLVWTLASLLVLGTVVHLVHSRQMQLNAGVFLYQAERALQQKEYPKAAELLERYLDYQPDDTEAIALYAAALEQGPGAANARFKTYLLLEQVLRREPDRLETRQHAVQAAIDVGRTNDAIRHLEYLLAVSPNDAELEHQLGWCLEAVGKYEESAKAFVRAIALAPQQIDSYTLLAELLARRLKQPDEATKVMDAMTAANPKAWQAYLVRARFYHGQGQFDAAAADVYKAAELAPQQDEVLLAAAEMALLQGNLTDARNRVNRALQLNPKEERLYRSLAALETRCGHADEAITCLERGLTELPDSVGLHVSLAELYLDKGQANEARKLLDWVRSNRPSPGLVDYLEGRLLMLDGQWPDAIDKLVIARARLGLASEWAGNLCASLGLCHERLGELDEQLTAYREAIVLNPANVQARLQFGKTLLAARLPEEAVVELRYLSTLPQAPPQTWALLAQALLERFQRRPPWPAEWKELGTALKRAAEANPGDAALPCLHAERLFLQGSGAQAVAMLKDAVAQHPDEVAIWTALAGLEAKLEQPAEALATLEKAQRQLGLRLKICQALVSFWAPRQGPNARAALAQVGDQAALLPRDDKVLLLRELAAALLLQGDKREAEKVLRQIGTLLPKDLNSRVLHFDLVLNDNRDGDAAAVLADLHRIEGDEGVLWRVGEAARDIWRARKGDLTRLEPARQRLAEVQKRRSDWGRAALLEAYLEDLGGQVQPAMESYRRAIDLGERPAPIVLRVAQYLADQHRFAEAGQVLRQLEDLRPLPPEHARLAAEIAVQNDELKRALTLAHKAVPLASRDYRDKLWLAHIQWLAGQPLEAEKTLREAVQTSPRVPDVWVALVRHLTRTKLSKHLEEAFEEMQQKLPPDRADLTLARCLEAAGRPIEAEAGYKKVLAGSPGDLAAVRQAAEFYLRGDQPAKAEPLLRLLLLPSTMAPADLARWARRQLAIVLALRNQPGDLEQAVALLDNSLPTRSASEVIQDERVNAFVLAKSPGRQAEAVRLFEQTLPKQPLTPDERFLLAQVYDANHEDAKANREMRVLLAIHRDQPRYVAYHIQWLLSRGEAEVAHSYLSALELLEPSSPRTEQLRAAYQKARAGG